MVLGAPYLLITFIFIITGVDLIVEGVELILLPTVSIVTLATLGTAF